MTEPSTPPAGGALPTLDPAVRVEALKAASLAYVQAGGYCAGEPSIRAAAVAAAIDAYLGATSVAVEDGAGAAVREAELAAVHAVAYWLADSDPEGLAPWGALTDRAKVAWMRLAAERIGAGRPEHPLAPRVVDPAVREAGITAAVEAYVAAGGYMPADSGSRRDAVAAAVDAYLTRIGPLRIPAPAPFRSGLVEALRALAKEWEHDTDALVDRATNSHDGAAAAYADAANRLRMLLAEHAGTDQG